MGFALVSTLSDIMPTIRIRLLLTVSDEATRHTKGSSHGLKIRLAILESTSQFCFPPKISAVRGVTFIVYEGFRGGY